MTDEEKDAKIKTMIDNLWKEHDDDGNGSLSREESRKMMKEMCKGGLEMRDDAFNQLFDEIDMDRSNNLD